MRYLKCSSFGILKFVVLTACATKQPLTGDISSKTVSGAFKPGSEIVIFTRSGYQHLVKVTSIEKDYLTGTIKIDEEHRTSWQETRFSYPEIERIEPVTEPGLAKKSGDVAKGAGAAVAGGGIIIVGYVALYALYTVLTFHIVKGLAF